MPDFYTFIWLGFSGQGHGGARLNRDFPLYYVTNARSARETGYAPAPSGQLLNLPL